MPSKLHNVTIVALHGFNSNATEFREKLAHVWDAEWAEQTRMVFLTAPLRRISCYGNAWYRSWHNYFTSYGDSGVAHEEEIDMHDLRETRRYVQQIVEAEKLLTSRVILVGESQGACCAIDAGMQLGVPVIALYGQRYVHTPLNARIPIYAFWGGRDTIISPHISMASLQGAHLTFVIGSTYTHADVGSKLSKFCNKAMQSITSSFFEI